MTKKDRSFNVLALWIVLAGGLLCLAVPLLAPFLSIQYLNEYGNAGNAIGGISNPLAQIIGSIMIFLALKAQIDANKIVQEQIEKENNKEALRHELDQLRELYLFVEKNIRNFSYVSTETTSEKPEKILLHSRRAIKYFVRDLENLDVDIHNNADVLMYDGVKEIMSVLNSAELFFNKIKNSTLDAQHKDFYATLMQHELLFSIFPYQDLNETVHLRNGPCLDCGEYHANYPPLIYDRLQDLKKNFM